jgi:hypothetical protein
MRPEDREAAGLDLDSDLEDVELPVSARELDCSPSLRVADSPSDDRHLRRAAVLLASLPVAIELGLEIGRQSLVEIRLPGRVVADRLVIHVQER